MQIAFLTLFLGLVAGPQPVALEPGAGVAAIELVLDGRAVARIEHAPWTATVDFGRALLPHHLEARGLGGDGAEAGRAELWINLPRPHAAVDIVLEGPAASSTRTARVTWDTLSREAPSEIQLSLDGAPLALDAQARARLEVPAAGAAHVLSARVAFASGLEARKDMVLSGDYGGDVATELTAVPVRAAAPGRPARALAAGDLRGRILAAGRPAAVAAVEQEPAEVFVVRTAGGTSGLLEHASGPRGHEGVAYGSTAVDPRLHFRLVSPVARIFKTGTAADVEEFDITPAVTGQGRDLAQTLLAARFGYPNHPRLADAIAAAGLAALGREAPRAVVLVAGGGDGAEDPSLFGAAAVRGYLRAIGVPFYVWSLDRPGRWLDAWGESLDVSTSWGLRRAYERLERDVLAQQIVWVQGRHLPQAITLAPGGGGAGAGAVGPAAGIELVAKAAPPEHR